jgi:hypothetical protein
MFEIYGVKVGVVYVHFANGFAQFRSVQKVLSLDINLSYLDCMFEVKVLKKELRHFSFLKNKDLNDGSKGGEAGKYDLICDLNDDCIIDTDQ